MTRNTNTIMHEDDQKSHFHCTPVTTSPPFCPVEPFTQNPEEGEGVRLECQLDEYGRERLPIHHPPSLSFYPIRQGKDRESPLGVENSWVLCILLINSFN